jgi:hypothetical protein
MCACVGLSLSSSCRLLAVANCRQLTVGSWPLVVACWLFVGVSPAPCCSVLRARGMMCGLL